MFRFDKFKAVLFLLALIAGVWWLWSWPYSHLRFYEVSRGQLWAFALLMPPLLLGLLWYATRPGRTRSDVFGALSFTVLGGYMVLLAVAGALQRVNAGALDGPGPAPVVRGVVMKHHAPRRRLRRSRALLPPTITVQLNAPAAGAAALPADEAATDIKLAVSDRAEYAAFAVGQQFAAPLRRGRLGWWFAPKQ